MMVPDLIQIPAIITQDVRDVSVNVQHIADHFNMATSVDGSVSHSMRPPRSTEDSAVLTSMPTTCAFDEEAIGLAMHGVKAGHRQISEVLEWVPAEIASGVMIELSTAQFEEEIFRSGSACTILSS
jgi:hypothetical protein